HPRRDDNEQCSSGSHSSAYRGSHYHAPTYPSLSTSSFRAFLLPSSILLFCELWARLLLTKRKLHLLPSLKMHRSHSLLQRWVSVDIAPISLLSRQVTRFAVRSVISRRRL